MFTVRGGKVVRLAPYVDMLDTLRQLGAADAGRGLGLTRRCSGPAWRRSELSLGGQPHRGGSAFAEPLDESLEDYL